MGTGSSFKDYPPGKHIMAVDISRGMMSRAEAKAKSYEGDVNLRREDVHRLSFDNGAFDTVFASCVFCSVSDPVKGLHELHRVLRGGGKLLMVEHVRSRGKVLGWIMDKLNPMVARYSVDNINRDTVDVLRKVGFRIEQDRSLAHDVVKAIIAVK